MPGVTGEILGWEDKVAVASMVYLLITEPLLYGTG